MPESSREPETASGRVDRPAAAIGELARKVAASPADIREAELKPLRDLGLSGHLRRRACGGGALHLQLGVGGDGAVPDSAYAYLDESLREVLTVGRPIERCGTGVSSGPAG